MLYVLNNSIVKAKKIDNFDMSTSLYWLSCNWLWDFQSWEEATFLNKGCQIEQLQSIISAQEASREEKSLRERV